MSTKLIVFVSFILALLVATTFAHCEEIVINTGTLPNDAVIYTAGEIPITVTIPNNKATNIFTIAFDSSRRWVNNNVGMRDYKYNVTLLSKPFYHLNTTQENYIQNFGSHGRFNYRTTGCYGASFPNMKITLDDHSVNCTKYMAIKHTGNGLFSFSKIPDEYYPMVLRIEPIYNNYTTYMTTECKDKSLTDCQICNCVTTKGIEFDESYFYSTKRESSTIVPSSSIVKYNSSSNRFLSAGSTIEHNFMLLIMFICFVINL